jgi:IstB-like ATP binding protein
MERSEILELMATIKLFGMRAAYDEVMATAIKRQYEPARIIGELLAAEIAEKKARSIRYQITIAKLPLAKDLDVSCRNCVFLTPPRERSSTNAPNSPGPGPRDSSRCCPPRCRLFQHFLRSSGT